jgi:hypothetical protein
MGSIFVHDHGQADSTSRFRDIATRIADHGGTRDFTTIRALRALASFQQGGDGPALCESLHFVGDWQG